MALEIDKEAIFPPSGIYSYHQFYYSCLSWFKIITHWLFTLTLVRT